MGSRGIDPLILNLGTRQGWTVNFIPLLLYPRGKNSCTHSVGGRVDPRTSLDIFGKRKISCLAGIRTPEFPVRSQVPILSELSRFQRFLAINLKYVHTQVFYYPEDGNRKILRNVGTSSLVCTVTCPWKRVSYLISICYTVSNIIFLGGIRQIAKRHNRAVSTPDEIRTRHLPNTNKKLYCLSKFAEM